MNALEISETMLPRPQPKRQRMLSVPLLVAVCWVCLQKECVWNPDLSPAHAVVDTDTAVTQPGSAYAGQEEAVSTPIPPTLTTIASPDGDRRSTNRSLRQASSLLRQAAAMLDNNDRTAIRVILQAITILKHEIMRGGDGLEFDRISLSPSSSERHKSEQDIRALLSVLHHQVSRYASTLQLDEQLAAPFPGNPN